MWVMDLQLIAFTPRDVERIEPWFDDPDTQRFLGGRDWIRRAPSLLELPIGEDYRGKVVTGRRMWLSLEENGEPVAFVDGEAYNRYAAWDGSDPDHPVVSDVVEVPSMGLVVVVDPARRRRGFGRSTIQAIIAHPDVAHIRLFFGEVEIENVASIRRIEKAGFRARSTEPDFEGMLRFSLASSGPTRRVVPERVTG
jgi:RimJ/RimL family protein N-acetyltransferase